jgi:nicotinic acid mononucleotide adenylyltransferase
MEKVIFDTNLIRNTEPNSFLGNRAELEKFAKVANIILPDMVIEELIHQKRRNLKNNKKSFLNNPFHWLKNLDNDETKSFDIDGYIKELKSKESISYDIIKLTNYSCMEEMKKLALKKLPPFESSAKTDKGFKDAYIYFTVLEYLQKINDKYIFFVGGDKLLKDAFKKHSNIYIVENFDEFMRKSISSFLDDYFMEKLQSEIDSKITKDSIIDYWISINDNHILYIEVENIKHIVEVNFGEIVNYKDATFYKRTLKGLIKSTDFTNTIESIKILKPYINYFSDNDAKDLLVALVENSQIRGTFGAGSYTIDFMRILYKKKRNLLSSEIDKRMPDGIK